MTNIEFARHRRLRQNSGIRALVRETKVSVDDFIYPIFIAAGDNVKNEIRSMPGIYQFSLDNLLQEVEEAVDLGIKAIILFGVPMEEEKDEVGTGAFSHNGLVQQGTKLIKQKFPEVLVIADTCLCEYTDHGHCGLVENGEIVNDASLEYLVKTAVSQAEAGADIIAPSNMMDGFVAAIRTGLDEAGYTNIPIMAYSVKYASSFYGPFRDAANGAPQFGDRKSYQMDPANRTEAMREAESDTAEGADFLIVKPGLAYLDIIRDVKNHFHLPIVAYNVSGEYSMVKAAAANGWIDEQAVILEILTGFKRAGADLIITYHAKEVASWLQDK